MPTIEDLEPRVYLSLTACPYIVPGDLTGENDVDLDDFVVLKTAQAEDMLAQFAVMKINWGPWDAIPIDENPDSLGTYSTIVGSLFVGGASPGDVVQSRVLGDCYYLAALAALADAAPEYVGRMIADLGDGTFITRFDDGHVVRMTMDLPKNTSGGLIYAGVRGDMWVALMEKAYAHVRYGADSYASLDAGWPDAALRQLTGNYAVSDWVWNYPDLPSHLESVLANGGAVTLVSQTTNVGPIVANHVYAVTDVIRDPAGEIVGIELYNPWGNYLSITIPQLLAGFRLVTEVEL